MRSAGGKSSAVRARVARSRSNAAVESRYAIHNLQISSSMRSARPPRASPSERNRPFRRSGNRGEGRRLSPVTINFSVSAYISVKIPRRRDQLPQKGAVVGQPPGYKMHHFAFAFKHPLDSHQARAEQLAPLALGEMGPDDDIDVAGFVLERDEHRSGSGARALTARDDARRACRAAARQ